MGQPEILLGGLFAAAQEALGEPTVTDEFDREAYRSSLAESVIALAKAEAGAAVLRAAITRALDGCSFCRMGQCRADAHLWLTDALADTQAGTALLIRLGQFEEERDEATRQRDKATAALEPAEAWMAHVLGILAGDGLLSSRVPTAECREDGRAILGLLREALAALPATEGG